MRRTLLAVSCLALLLVVVLVAGAGLGAAQTGGPVPDARPTPTPILPLPEWSPPEAASPEIPPLPDLIVTAIEVSPPIPRIGDTVTIRVTIKNQSPYDLDPTNNFWSDLYVDPGVQPPQLGQDGVWEWGCQAVWVPAGGTHILQTNYIFDDVRTFSLWAQVDTDAHVLESNENNNLMGPVLVQVVAQDRLVHQTHEQFQMGMASSLDASHPQGVIRRGIFWEPANDPGVYTPDAQVDRPPLPPTNPNNVNQVKPALASCETCLAGNNPAMFAVWEDGRNGGVFNRDIYFARYNVLGETWLPAQDVRVNSDDQTGNQVSPDIVYDPTHGPANVGRLYAVWQDERDGNFDIYIAYSDNLGDSWLGHTKLNDDTGTAHQLNPAIAIGSPPRVVPADPCEQPAGPAFFDCGGNCVYVVWQDQRNGNDDVYLARSSNGGVNWTPNYFVTDDPNMTAQNQAAPSIGVESYYGHVYVGWEDWRDPLHPEVYVMRSFDGGVSFGIDVPVVAPAAQSYRQAPSLVAETTLEEVEEVDPVTGITYTVETPVSVAHVAWQEGKDPTTDVYYSYAPYDWCQPQACPWPYELCFAGRQKVSGFVVDSDYVLPPDDPSWWYIEPSWQGQVSLDFVPDLDQYSTYCHADSTTVYSKGVMIAWSDARSYDDWRYEIRTRRAASPEGDPETYEICEDWAEGMVNSNAKLITLRDDPDLYNTYKPAAASAYNPVVRVDEAGIYVAWDDDRWDDPSVKGTLRNRDVFATRWGMREQGVYISPVLNGRTEAPLWYVLSWWGATQHYGDVLFQTRFGNNPSPPQNGSAPGNGWTAWTGNTSSAGYLEPGCNPTTRRGVGCTYDAPGRHIVRPDGTDWFTNPAGTAYRYMQYKLIIRGYSRLTAVSQVTIHYKGGGGAIYIPVVLKRR